MKRDFLKNLGIEDKELIDKILDENSADIGRAKGELDTYKTKVSDLENDIKTKEKEIDTLKTQVGDTKALNDKISQLETDKTKLSNDLNAKVSEIQKTHAIESKIRDAKGKNVKAIMALLDMEKITYENDELGGIDDQLTTLASAEDSSMLFGDKQIAPAGTHIGNSANSGSGANASTSKTFADAIASGLNNNKK